MVIMEGLENLIEASPND